MSDCYGDKIPLIRTFFFTSNNFGPPKAIQKPKPHSRCRISRSTNFLLYSFALIKVFYTTAVKVHLEPSSASQHTPLLGFRPQLVNGSSDIKAETQLKNGNFTFYNFALNESFCIFYTKAVFGPLIYTKS